VGEHYSEQERELDFPARAHQAREVEFRVINEEDIRNHSLVEEECEVKQVREEALRHKFRNEVVTINHNRTVLGTINLNQQLIGVMDSSRKVAKETTDEGNRVLGEEVMLRHQHEEDIRINPSLTNQL